MKPEDIIKLIKEGSYEALEGLEALASMGKNLTIAGHALESASQDARKIMDVAGKISKKMAPHKP